jgi:hypothetical protein
MRQRRVAGGEIVDGQPDTRGVERLEHFELAIRVVHHHTFRELDLDRLGIETVIAESPPHEVQQPGIAHLCDREVDRDPQTGKPGRCR